MSFVFAAMTSTGWPSLYTSLKMVYADEKFYCDINDEKAVNEIKAFDDGNVRTLFDNLKTLTAREELLRRLR